MNLMYSILGEGERGENSKITQIKESKKYI